MVVIEKHPQIILQMFSMARPSSSPALLMDHRLAAALLSRRRSSSPHHAGAWRGPLLSKIFGSVEPIKRGDPEKVPFFIGPPEEI